jgi:hypothetical protein
MRRGDQKMGEANRRKKLDVYPEINEKQKQKKMTKREIINELSARNPMLTVAGLVGGLSGRL